MFIETNKAYENAMTYKISLSSTPSHPVIRRLKKSVLIPGPAGTQSHRTMSLCSIVSSLAVLSELLRLTNSSPLGTNSNILTKTIQNVLIHVFSNILKSLPKLGFHNCYTGYSYCRYGDPVRCFSVYTCFLMKTNVLVCIQS